MTVSAEKTAPVAYVRTVRVMFLILFIIAAVHIAGFQYQHVLKRVEVSFTSPFKIAEPDYRRGFDGDLKYFLTVAGAIVDGHRDFYNPHAGGGPGVLSLGITYPPTAYFLFVPFSGLSLLQLGDLFLYFKIALIMASGYFLTSLSEGGDQKISSPVPGSVFIFCMIFLFSPTLEDMRWGQINLHLMALMLLAVYLVQRKIEIAAGAVLGLIFCIKFISAPFIIYLVLTKRMKIAASALVSILLINGAFLISAGPVPYLSFFKYTSVKILQWQEHFNNQNIHGLLKFICNRCPTASNILWGWIPLLGALFAVLAITYTFHLLLRRRDDCNLLFSASLLLILIPLISPVSWPAHHVWLIPAVVLLTGPIFRNEPLSKGEFLSGIAGGLMYLVLMVFDGSNAASGPGLVARVEFLQWRGPFFLNIALWALMALKCRNVSVV